MSKYKDPDNINDLLGQLKNCPTLGDIYKLVNYIFPDWIIEFIDNYSHDYPHLRQNWIEATKKFNVKPAKIMIVDYIGLTDEYSFIQHIAEVYTILGFIVRSKDELEVCDVCNRAIPGEAQYEYMKSLSLPVPEKWSSICSGCIKEDE